MLSLLALFLAVALAACGGSKGTPTVGGTSSAPAAGAPGGTKVTVSGTDFALKLSQNTFAAGAYTFVVRNEGATVHALTIKGPGTNDAQTPIIPAGGSAELTVTLQPGSYQLWCPVGNHRQLGMETTIEVGAASGPAAPTSTGPSDTGSAGVQPGY